MKPIGKINETGAVLVITVCFLVIGTIMIFSASSVKAFHDYQDSLYYLKRHAMWAIIGIASFFIFSKINYRKLRSISPLAVIITTLLLVAVLIPGVGIVLNGARRWINLGPLGFQPSEFAKIALLVYGAMVLSSKKGKTEGIRDVTNLFSLLVLISAVLILRQPDLGTALLIGINTLILFFLAGVRLRILAPITLASIFAVFIAIMTEKYRRQRLFSFLDPWADPRGSGFHLIQSLAAFGSGGFFGVGLGSSLQKFSYLPQAHTDFIFAIVGEEFGLIGTLSIIMLYLAFGYFGLKIAYRATDRFGKLLAGGIVGSILIQAVINIGAVSGVLPITGVPLPFISYGGTALLINLTAVGILKNIGQSQRIEVLSEDHDMWRRNRRPRISGGGNRSRASKKKA